MVHKVAIEAVQLDAEPIYIDKEDAIELKMTPQQALLRNLTYEKNVTAVVSHISTTVITGMAKNVEVERCKVFLGKMPIMVKSNHCSLYVDHKKRTAAAKVTDLQRHDFIMSGDLGGYFIINGKERVWAVKESKIIQCILKITRENIPCLAGNCHPRASCRKPSFCFQNHVRFFLCI